MSDFSVSRAPPQGKPPRRKHRRTSDVTIFRSRSEARTGSLRRHNATNSLIDLHTSKEIW